MMMPMMKPVSPPMSIVVPSPLYFLPGNPAQALFQELNDPLTDRLARHCCNEQ
jgi:hypothetical protein